MVALKNFSINHYLLSGQVTFKSQWSSQNPIHSLVGNINKSLINYYIIIIISPFITSPINIKSKQNLRKNKVHYLTFIRTCSPFRLPGGFLPGQLLSVHWYQSSQYLTVLDYIVIVSNLWSICNIQEPAPLEHHHLL